MLCKVNEIIHINVIVSLYRHTLRFFGDPCEIGLVCFGHLVTLDCLMGGTFCECLSPNSEGSTYSLSKIPLYSFFSFFPSAFSRLYLPLSRFSTTVYGPVKTVSSFPPILCELLIFLSNTFDPTGYCCTRDIIKLVSHQSRALLSTTGCNY